jgi:uracil-DNA glycosylase
LQSSIESKTIKPSISKIFNFARYTELSDIKVVILGRYPNDHADGLAYSSKDLNNDCIYNIFQAMRLTTLEQKSNITLLNQNADLTYLAKQGVLLLNTTLTKTNVNVSNIHEEIWEQYTKMLIGEIAKLRPIIFLLWGDTLYNKFADHISKSNEQSIILNWSNPSVKSIKRPFEKCDHFIQINKILPKLGHDKLIYFDQKTKFELYLDINKEINNLVVYTDGSAYPNNSSTISRAGYACCFYYGNYKNMCLYGNIEVDVAPASNIRAEAAALYRTMLFLSTNLNWDKCIIITDSEFWIKMYDTYMPKWEKDNTFSSKKNYDITLPMYNLYKTLKSKIKLIHVYAHTKKYEKYPKDTYEYISYIQNDYVDKLANYARTKLKPGDHIIADKLLSF